MGMIDRLPTPFSERETSLSQALFERNGREADVAVAGVPFRRATSQETPEAFETVSIRKEQFDAEVDAGEQSLSGNWWRRSQASFHEGAGLLYQEEDGSNAPSFGFASSRGLDVFSKKGRITMLRRMVSVETNASRKRLRSYATGTKVSVVNGSTLQTGNYDGAVATLHTAAATVQDGIVGGTNFVDITDTTLHSGTVASPGTATTWPLTGNGARRMEWGKHRLWIIGGQRIWQPNLSLAGSTAQDPVFTHPDANWTYTCLAEAGSGMLFAGHDGRLSSIQIITLDQDGFLPGLSGATETAVFPEGELVHEIAVLAGQLVGIGTNRGFRIGRVSDGGRITYGPLLCEPAGITTCTAITTQGRFFVVAFNSTEGAIAYRFDTGTEIEELIHPYAEDIQHESGTYIQGLAVVTTGLASLNDAGERRYQHATEFVSSGFLQTGRIRYRTNENKTYKFLNVEIDPLKGAIAASAILEGGSSLPIGSITVEDDLFDEAFAINATPMRYISLKFVFTRSGSNATLGPTMYSYLLRAIPTPRPQHRIVLPLLCFDFEMARSGQRYGGAGYAQLRLNTIEQIEANADTVTFQDFSLEDATGRIVLIESMRFVQTSPPNPTRAEGAGGILILTLLTMDP